MKHAFTSAAAAAADPLLVDGPNWNEVHVSGIRELSVDDAADTTDDYIEATGGVSGITITLPPCAGLAGHRFEVQKVDSGAGAVLLDGTINGDAGGYQLSNQFQYVAVQVRADESGYIVVKNN